MSLLLTPTKKTSTVTHMQGEWPRMKCGLRFTDFRRATHENKHPAVEDLWCGPNDGTTPDCPQCLEALRVSAEPDAVDEKYADSPDLVPTVVSRPPDARRVLIHNGQWEAPDFSVWVPLDQLPRILRELAALMTEEQRLKLALEMSMRSVPSESIGRRLERPIDLCTPSGTSYEEVYRKEGGPGISSLSHCQECGKFREFRHECDRPLSFLDEDLLCGDE